MPETPTFGRYAEIPYDQMTPEQQEAYRFAVETRGPLMVSGHVQGNGRIGGTLSMSKSAHWRGDITARQAVLAGHVVGKIVIEDKLEVSASAVIQGEIVAKVLAIANGARIEGEVTVTSGKAIVKFEEKRASA